MESYKSFIKTKKKSRKGEVRKNKSRKAISIKSLW